LAKCTATRGSEGIRLRASRNATAALAALGLPRLVEILRGRRLELRNERLVVRAVGGVVVDAAHLGGNSHAEDDGVCREEPPHAHRASELAIELRGANVAERAPAPRRACPRRN
jgi:hypothetical protein